jgi:hypothetical protein
LLADSGYSRGGLLLSIAADPLAPRGKARQIEVIKAKNVGAVVATSLHS